MTESAAAFTTRLEGPAPEVSVSRDIVRRGIIAAPVLVALCGVIWGVDGAWSSAYAIALVLLNFGLAAALIAVTARISLTLMMAAILFGSRNEHHRHAPRAPDLGDEVRGDLSRPPRPQARPPVTTHRNGSP
jgi:hypothetical protein